MTRREAPARPGPRAQPVPEGRKTAGPGRRRARGPVSLTVLACLVGLLALSPLGYVVGQAAGAGWLPTWRLVTKPATLALLGHTFSLTLAVVAAGIVLGGGGAWLLERTKLPARRFWAVLLPLPIAVPAFVSAFAWVSVLPAMSGFLGAFTVMTLATYPLVLLPTAAVLRDMDPALEEVAASLGQGPWRIFWRTVLPQAMPALAGGALLVALETLAEFGAFSMLNYSTFTTTIYDQYNLTFDGPVASMLAMVLVFACLVLLIAELRVRGRRRYAHVGGGVDRRQSRRSLGRTTPLVMTGLGTLTVAALGVPAGIIAYWITYGRTGRLPLDSLGAAVATSLGLSLAAALTTTAAALPVALLVVRHRSALALLIDRATYLAHGLPGVVVALALVVLSIRYLRPLYQTPALLVIAYVIVFLPLAVVGVRASMARVSAVLPEAARSLGVGPFRAFLRVVLPLIGPGAGAAAALVFLGTMNELTVTLMLAPPGLQTLSTVIWTDTTNLDYPAAAPYAAVMIAVCALPTYLLTNRLGRPAAA
ncbi:MAG TPA: iron ABC transporter permease [Microbacteriaceae bacterium]|nr:iron ABC transporter permease [Microbacteriaceae bacterium]